MAVHFEDKAKIIRMADGETIAEIGPVSNDYVWGPDGGSIAFTRSPTPLRGAMQETQLFIHDLRTGNDRQLTHFPAKDYRPWWQPFSPPLLRYPIVTGVSWAPRANIIGFYVAPDRELHIWNPDGYEIKKITLEGNCFRDTQLDTDGQRVMYIDPSSAGRCLDHAWDQIRLANLSTGDDRIIVDVNDENVAIEKIYWATD